MTDLLTFAKADGPTLPARIAGSQTYGFIAKRGGGKTYAASKLVEEMDRVGIPCAIIDPVGNWWGLRLAADGKKPGLSFVVFGGEHGDIPIGEDMGKRLASVIIERNMSAVIDVSRFRKNERKRFVADFAEELFHLAGKKRTPRMIVFEEAQVFAPQHPRDGEQRMLGAVEDIVRLGRNMGLGSMLISQRPQSVNKEVLNQVEALFVGQLSGPHERKAIAGWITERGAEAAKEIDRVAELRPGHMLLWSPSWLRTFAKVQIAPKWTYDASATPELGKDFERVKPLARADMAELRTLLAPAVTPTRKAKVNPIDKDFADGVNARIVDLENELVMERERSKEYAADLHRWVTWRALFRSALDTLRRELDSLDRELPHGARPIIDPETVTADCTVCRKTYRRGEVPDEWQCSCGGAIKERPKDPIAWSRDIKPAHAPRQKWASAPAPKIARRKVPDTSGFELKSGARRMLTTLADMHPATMTKAQVAKATKMKVTGGTFLAYWGELRRYELITLHGSSQHANAEFRITEKGLVYLGRTMKPVPKDYSARIAFWNERLKSGERRIWEVVRKARKPISKAAIADAVEMEATGGTFLAYLGTLTRNRLIVNTGGAFGEHPWLSSSA